jgi:3-methyladenine DNA glycosylase AlkC
MSSLLKDRYSISFYDSFLIFAEQANVKIDNGLFYSRLMDSSWEELSLKQRMRKTTEVLHTFLSKELPVALRSICDLVEHLKNNLDTEYSLEYLFLADYVALYAIENVEEAIQAMEVITTFTSCEFAIRPFFVKYPSRMLQQVILWTEHSNYHIRRLASEGSRPRLPWGEVLSQFVAQPEPLFEVLGKLKGDKSEYVRRSVANSLNDISKSHPDLVINTIKHWKGSSKETDALIKHGVRTLLKAGNKEALELLGVSENPLLELHHFSVQTSKVTLGDYLAFQCNIANRSSVPVAVRIEYRVYFKRITKEEGSKVFKISEKTIQPNQEIVVNKRHSFKPITTRSYYPGLHGVAIIINGKEFERIDFELV